MPIDINYWRQLVKETVNGIADEDMQRRSWFGKGPEVFSPEEMFCQFFNDAAIEDFITRNDTGINQEQREAGKYLVELMKKLSDKTPDKYIDPNALIEDSLMTECRQAAKDFLNIL